jgi:N-acyl-D-amino-acid deacylase
VLAERKWSMDVGTQVPHGPLRTYVMGERGVKHEAASDAEIAEMARLAAEAVRAGALSFSTSRILGHQSTSGSPVPGTHAAREELLGIGRAVGRAGGIIEIVPGGSVGQAGFAIGTNEPKLYEELEWMDVLSRETGMAITFLIVEFMENPDAWKDALRWIEDANRRGAKLRPQTAGRPGGLLTGFQGKHIFARRPTYVKLAALPLAERVRELRKPEVRAAILAEDDLPPTSAALMDSLHIFLKRGIAAIFPLGNPVDYEPTPDQSVVAQATRDGVDPEARIYDLMCEDEGKAMLLMPTLNYARGSHDALYAMLSHPDSILGLADGGAHCNLICDASTPTYMLTHWVRDRSRGPRLTLEHAVKKQTSETAELYGLRDRGVIAPGKRADLNVIDFDALHIPPPYVVRDLPAGGQRMMQDAKGYVATIVAGTVTRRDDQDTGARPGRLVRGARAD